MDSTSDLIYKLKYPKSIWFIVLNELCERFSYYGLRTVLVLYLTTILMFNDDESTMIYHSFVSMSYFMPMFGAILADSYWGKFDTIIRLSIVYALGNVILTVSSTAEMFSLNVQRIVALIGLLFISTGTGGIKPCVFAFGGDQFRLPQQELQLQRYTSIFLIAVNVGALISTFLTPELRHDIHCFGRNTCYPLAFGVPAVLMLIAIVLFVAGKNMYVRKKPEYNVISRTFGCIFYALRIKLTSSVRSKSYWLDNAKGVYAETEIKETKAALNAITIFIAFPVFWALYEQQGSRWTLQGTLMNGRIDYWDWTIKPDQMQTLIPFFGIIFFVLCNVAFFPLLAMVGIRKPLQKFTISGLLAIVAFIIAALLQFKIIGKTPEIPPGEGNVNIYNGVDCEVFVHSELLPANHIDPLKMINFCYEKVSRKEQVDIGLKFDPECSLVPRNFVLNTTISIFEGQEVSYYLTKSKTNIFELNRIGDHDNLAKDKLGNPKLRLLTDNTFDLADSITLLSADDNFQNSYSFPPVTQTNFTTFKTGKYNLLLNGQAQQNATVDLKPATFYTLILQRNDEIMDIELFTAYEGNYLHILWQVPQFLCMIIADVFFILTSTEFSFVEAPMSMKSFVSAISLLATAAGNLLVVIISAVSIQNQAHEYLLYAGLMFVDTMLLVYFNYVYKSNSEEENNTATVQINKNNTKVENVDTSF